MRSRPRSTRVRRGVGVLSVALLVIGVIGAAATPVAATPVTVPCPQPQNGGLVPSQVGARYGLQPLWDAGFRGRGVVAGLVELGTAVDAEVVAQYQVCLGQSPTPFTSTQVGSPVTLDPSNESMADAEMIVGLAPQLDSLHEFTNGGGDGNALVATLQAALDQPATEDARPTSCPSASTTARPPSRTTRSPTSKTRCRRPRRAAPG
jgi:hypothetical protein